MYDVHVGVTFYYDGLGSTRSLTDINGSVTDTYLYNAYGNVIDQTGSTLNNYLFTGEQYDSSQGNYYLRERYYDPDTGSFQQMDTWLGRANDPVTLHKYLYANGDPVNLVDPSGMTPLLESGATSTINGILTTIVIQGPRLGFVFLKNAGGHIVGIAATTCVVSYIGTNFGIIEPIAAFSSACDGSAHRGRWQAQGGGIQVDEPWSQPTPLTLTQGLQLLNRLETRLSARDRRARAVGFEQARLFANRAAGAGGLTITSGVFKRSFPPGATLRVDLDIFKGTAFVAD